jgi:hypothetical protein
LTRRPWASKLVNDGFGKANLSCGTGSLSRGLCIRLRCRDDARTGDAVLQFDVVLVTRSSRSGLLQNHAIDACSFCTALLHAGRFLLSSCVRSAASDWQVSRSRFLQSRDCDPLPRSADPLRSGPVAPSRLVSPPVGSRLEAFVCFDIPVSTGGTVCENTRSILHR